MKNETTVSSFSVSANTTAVSFASVLRCHGAALSASKFRRGATSESAATSMAGFLLNFSSVAVEQKQKQSQSLPLACPEIASCQPCTQLFWSCLGFAVLKNNLPLSSHLLRVLQQKGIYTYLVRIPTLCFVFSV